MVLPGSFDRALVAILPERGLFFAESSAEGKIGEERPVVAD
jgi:hypothetical protein